MHAFIIEDDYLIGQSLQDMLEQLGFNSFSHARSEDAAILGARDQNINLLVADVRLKPGDGLAAVEAICRKRHIPVIFTTGYVEELKARAPAVTIVQKPVTLDALARAVQHALRRRNKPAPDATGS